MTAEAILRLVNDPVLPFYPLDIALDVQNKLKGDIDDNMMVSMVVMIICSVLTLIWSTQIRLDNHNQQRTNENDKV